MPVCLVTYIKSSRMDLNHMQDLLERFRDQTLARVSHMQRNMDYLPQIRNLPMNTGQTRTVTKEVNGNTVTIRETIYQDRMRNDNNYCKVYMTKIVNAEPGMIDSFFKEDPFDDFAWRRPKMMSLMNDTRVNENPALARLTHNPDAEWIPGYPK